MAEEPFQVETPGGRVRCRVGSGGSAVEVEMGHLDFYSAAIPVTGPLREVVDEPIVYPDPEPARVTALTVILQPGEITGWHRHGVPLFGFMLEGELTVQYIGERNRTSRRATLATYVCNSPAPIFRAKPWQRPNVRL